MSRVRNRIYMVEGITCSGKTTMIKDITSVLPYASMLEHPPRLDNTDDWIAHQDAVFEEFAHAYDLSDRDVFTDFSPFACIPFTLALCDIGAITEDACLAQIERFADRCDSICKRHLIYVHRYLHISLETCISRLNKRNRKGDDTWDENLLAALIPRYDEFFLGGLLEMKKDRAIGVKRFWEQDNG